MAVTNLGPEVQLPALQPRPYGRFLDVVPQIPVMSEGEDRSCLGAVFMAPNALAPILLETSCDPDTKAGAITLGEYSQPSAVAYNAFECSTVAARPERLEALIATDADMVLSAALASLATTQLSADYLALDTDSTSVGSGSTAAALALIEAGLAARISNAVGNIFVSVTRIAEALNSASVMLTSDGYRSATGHRVIVDAGHGTDDAIYATGPMAYVVSANQTLSSPTLNPTRNQLTWWRERCLTVLFNPDWSVRASIT